MKLNFYKDPDNRWYVDLPDWTGTKADLEMVSGADTMLDHILESNKITKESTGLSDEEFLEYCNSLKSMSDIWDYDSNTVSLTLSLDNIDGYDLIKITDKPSDDDLGAFYLIESYKGRLLNLEIWLCPVMLYVFGEYPKEIYIHADNI